MKIALGLEHPLAMRGGVSVLVEKLIEGMAGHHEVVLVSPDEAGFMHSGIVAHVHWEPTTASRRTSRQLTDRLAELEVSLAHLHAGGAFGWGWRVPGHSPMPFLHEKGIACVSTIHIVLSLLDGYCGPNKPAWFKLAVLPVAWLGKLDALRFVHSEIVISQEGWRRARRRYWPMRNRFRWLYHSRLPAAPPAAPPAREPLVLCVGHTALRKGQHTLAAAFAKIAGAHPDWKLAVLGHAGPDSCFSQIQEITAAHRLQDRVLLPGSRDDALDWMRRATIYVQPSVFEGLPLALQEAMFCGCACVATKVVGNDELIEHERTGLLVPPLKPDALADTLERLIQDPALRERLGRAAAASVIERGMTAPKMVQQHLALYESIGQPRRAGAAAAMKQYPPRKPA
jgi:glycosyltransferase involved in cell wall biosynthesis